jgi:predicted XRE-type DNA-binding protein
VGLENKRLGRRRCADAIYVLQAFQDKTRQPLKPDLDLAAVRQLTQAQAADRLGLTQPRLNDLLRGRINRFSLDALIGLAKRAGLTVRMEITRAAA